MKRSIAAVMAALLATSCNKESGGGNPAPAVSEEQVEQTDSGGGSDTSTQEEQTSTETKDVCSFDANGTALPDVPSPSLSAGVVALTVPADIDPASVEGQIVGEPDLKVQRGKGCKFFIEDVPAGKYDIVLTAGSVAVSTAALTEVKKDRAVRINGLDIAANKILEGGETKIPLAGMMKGSVVKDGNSDNLGIDVFIPGVQFAQVKTNESGAYKFDFLPVGVNEFAFKTDGYRDGRLIADIKSGQEFDAGKVVLALSNLGANQVRINSGDEASSNLTVEVIVAASDDAIRMKVAENESFSGAAYEDLATYFTYTFDSFGSAPYTTPRKICVALENKDGSEVSNCDTIILDPFAQGGNAFTPVYSVASDAITAATGVFNFSNITVPDGATSMFIGLDGVDANWVTPASTYQYVVAAQNANCGGFNLKVQFKNSANQVSTASTKAVSNKCWQSISETGAPSSRYGAGSFAVGGKLYIWGGRDGSSFFSNGGVYNIANNTWTSIAGSVVNSAMMPQMAGRAGAVIAWGGYFYSASDMARDTGVIIKEDGQSIAMESTGAPAARYGFNLLYTGNHNNAATDDLYIIMGGQTGSGSTSLGDGAIFSIPDPTGDANGEWASLDMTGAAPIFQLGQSAVWTGPTGDAATAFRVITFGGFDGTATYTNAGGIYDHSQASGSRWSSTTTTGAPSGRRGHLAFWTGNTGDAQTSYKMVIWGGFNAGGALNDGGIYDPKTNTWDLFDNTNAPDFLTSQTGTFPSGYYPTKGGMIGDKMVIYNNNTNNSSTRNAVFNVKTKTWRNFGAEADRTTNFTTDGIDSFSVASTETGMAIWGGFVSGMSSQKGGIYYPWSAASLAK